MSGRLYLECAALLSLGYAALWALRQAWLWAGGAGSARAWLRSAQAVLLAALILPSATRALPDGLFPAGLFSRAPRRRVAHRCLRAGGDRSAFTGRRPARAP